MINAVGHQHLCTRTCVVHPLLNRLERRASRAVTAGRRIDAHVHDRGGRELQVAWLRRDGAADLRCPVADFDVVRRSRGEPEQTAHKAAVGDAHEYVTGMPGAVARRTDEQLSGGRQITAVHDHADRLDVRIQIQLAEAGEAGCGPEPRRVGCTRC